MNLTLLTDFYELTMLAGYFELGKTSEKATFDLFFRKIPSQGGFCIAAGLEDAIDYIKNLHFSREDIEYLYSLKTFSADFLEYLREFSFSGELYAVPEGTLVFPNEPLIRITAPLAEAQFLETALLNIIGFQTLIATKAARICLSARGREVIEFGARRAQGPDGAMSASRASYIGGCSSTSNTLAGKKFEIPVQGTMAHSWIQSFDTELEAFEKYARVFPVSSLFLVDTYDTIEGVKNAIRIGLKLKEEGKRLKGIRLDSGDLKKLSIEARKLLDEAGLEEAKIVASNDLDEWIVQDLLSQGAQIDIFGVGTSLVISRDAPALGVVYKLVAIEKDGKVCPKIKISGNIEKITNPGVKKIVRFLNKEKLVGDVLMLEDEKAYSPMATFDQFHSHKRKTISGTFEEILQPIFLEGKLFYKNPALPEIRQRTLNQLDLLDEEYKRLLNPEIYWLGLSKKLFRLKQGLLREH
ncbi:MAG: nicotinate phosphoribosyltransferase [Parcubacteria group bacterium CG08_land_8_20_14_0_20_38_56]|nr:MAG: nicotinate phosphoribosyltransferase [Parcubacteria group bacterium CG08_land_8_20_14_0_20_38_56]